jgi:hypothetical protein
MVVAALAGPSKIKSGVRISAPIELPAHLEFGTAVRSGYDTVAVADLTGKDYNDGHALEAGHLRKIRLAGAQNRPCLSTSCSPTEVSPLPRQLRSCLHLVPLFLLTAGDPAMALAQSGKEPPPVNLAPVLDGKAALWQVGPFGGKADHALTEIDGRTTLVIGSSGLDLTTAAPITRDTEVRAVLRFTSPKDVGTNTYIFAGLKKVTDSVENPLQTVLHIPAGPREPCPARRTGQMAFTTSRISHAIGSPGPN